MKVLSLFDGISCGRVALERAGIPVEKYYASEIDRYAISVAQAMYPDTVQVGDVNKLNYLELLDVDMIIGGSPCQDLSIAKQNRQGLQGERSRLFWEYIKALTIIKPKYFLLENVASMKNEDRDAITETLKRIYPETECIMINSALVSAQQRKRYYWTNWHVEQPEDKGILLKDVLEKLSAPHAEPVTKRSLANVRLPEEKANCFLATSWKGPQANGMTNVPVLGGDPVPDREKSHAVISSVGRTTEREYFKKNQGQLVFEPVRLGTLPGVGKGQANRIYSVRGKSVCLGANGGGGGAKTGLYKIDLPDGDYIVRKLTPRECARLQTYPERCFDVANISNTQWYKAFGNGWTVDVISHIFSQIPEIKRMRKGGNK